MNSVQGHVLNLINSVASEKLVDSWNWFEKIKMQLNNLSQGFWRFAPFTLCPLTPESVQIGSTGVKSLQTAGESHGNQSPHSKSIFFTESSQLSPVIFSDLCTNYF